MVEKGREKSLIDKGGFQVTLAPPPSLYACKNTPRWKELIYKPDIPAASLIPFINCQGGFSGHTSAPPSHTFCFQKIAHDGKH